MKNTYINRRSADLRVIRARLFDAWDNWSRANREADEDRQSYEDDSERLSEIEDEESYWYRRARWCEHCVAKRDAHHALTINRCRHPQRRRADC